MLKKRFLKFIFVGILNSVVGYGSYSLFIFLRFGVVIANTFSTIIGIINSYVFNRKVTFNDCKVTSTTPFKFVSVYIVNYIFGSFLLVLMTMFGVNAYLAGFINLFVSTLISWFGHNYFSFR